VPKEVYDRFSPNVQLLFRHLVEGVEDVIQPENQARAFQAMDIDDDPDSISDNTHVVAGAMTIEEWRNSKSQN